MVLFSCEYRFKRGVWCRVESLSLCVLGSYIAEQFTGNDFDFKAIAQKNHSNLYQDNSPYIPTLKFLSNGAVFLGDSHTDKKLTGTRNFYTSNSFEVSAMVEFLEYKKSIMDSSENYYLQKWI